MDFLDPKKQRQHRFLLYTGYVLIAIAILISTVVLVYQANGYGVNSKGQVVQNGLVFFSSQPNPATIYLNGQRNNDQTNNRLSLPAGQYRTRLTRSGYREWQRTVTVQGGDVQHFDYPFLFPTTLTPKVVANLPTAPGISSQSRDKRWLVLQTAANATTFSLYDLKSTSPTPVTLSLPSNEVTTGTAAQSWQVVQWSDDNVHLLLQHTYGDKSEFIELDRSDPTKSININQALTTNPSAVTLNNNAYDQLYLFDAANSTLSQADLSSKAITKVLSNVISYKSYGDSTLLYATADNAPANKVSIDMLAGGHNYLIRQVNAGTSYLLDMANYSGVPYVVIGASSENAVYIYRDPIAQLSSGTLTVPAAVRAFKLANPSYVGFSPNAQFIVAESGTHFALYDTYLHRTYQYTTSQPLDAPQVHASWMDGDRLNYVSANSLRVFDYDHTNSQNLLPINPATLPFYSPDYHYVYTVTTTDGVAQLSQTPLLTAADL